MPVLDLSELRKIKSFELVPDWNFFVDFTVTVAALQQQIVNYININKFGDVEGELAEISGIADKLGAFDLSALSLSVKTITAPDIDVIGQTVNLGGINIDVADTLQMGNGNSLTMTFYATTGEILPKFYYLWLSIMFNFAEDYKRPKGTYEAPISIYIYNRVNQLICKRTYNACSPRSLIDRIFDASETKYLDPTNISFRVNGGVEIDFY